MGCYRSGTSAIAGILHHLGVNMGVGFQEPNAQNPKGYFEDPDFIKANLKIYEAMNQDDDFEYHNGIFEAKKAFHELCKLRSIQILSRHRSTVGSDIWGFKDPKFCVVAKHVELHPDTKIIWIHRDVDETALSIIKSLSLHGEDANMDKWRTFVEHYRDQTTNYMAGCDALHTLDINFPNLLENPRTCINVIADFISMQEEGTVGGWNIPNVHSYDEHLGCPKIRKAYEFMGV